MSPRQEFMRWYAYQLTTFDCDPAIYVMRYLIARYELNMEQRYWLCWLYANTYQLPTAWVMFNEFPDYENVCAKRIDHWCKDNVKRLPYQKDQKWLRGKLGETFASYKENLGDSDQLGWFLKHRIFGPSGGFETLWKHINSKFHRFGRYTTWFYLQALSEVCELDLTPTSLFLGDPSSKMPRTGLVRALLHELQDLPPCSNDAENCKVLDQMAIDLCFDVREAILPDEASDYAEWPLPVKADLFSLETSLCSWAKIERGGPKGRYLGYYLDRFAEDITATSDQGWDGINWDALWEARDEILLPELNHKKVRLDEMECYPLLGTFCSDEQLLQRLAQYVNLP